MRRGPRPPDGDRAKSARYLLLARHCTLALGGIALSACGATAHPPVIKEYSTPFQSRLKDPGDTAGIPADLPSVMDRAAAASKAGKADEALYYFVKALEIDPANTTALTGVGHIHRDKGNYELAEVAYRLVLKGAPRHAEALEGLGLVKLDTHAYPAAAAALNAAIMADPKRWRAHNALGLIASQAGHHSEAQNHYAAALRLQPGNPEVLNNLGYAKYLAQDWSGALDAFEAALDSDPRYEPAWMNKGLVLARQGNEKAALAAFRRILNDADAYNDLGYIYLLQGDTDKAHELFEKAIHASPTYHEKANENLRRLLEGDFSGLNINGSGRE